MQESKVPSIRELLTLKHIGSIFVLYLKVIGVTIGALILGALVWSLAR
ncbi:MAG: hypothetical protein Q7T01_01750 [bacterium]|nr:hypothetical protein [bacterium]